ncbi:MAG: hypothetical protein ABMA64_09665 [Myxococcota bacterium]
MQLRNRVVAVGFGVALVGTDAAAEIDPGIGGVYDGGYEIVFNGQVIGHVVVTHANPPPGYAADTEYWHWNPGQAWRGAFRLVPAGAAPSYTAYPWQVFPHEVFDLAHTVPFPVVGLTAGDAFYKVSVKSGSTWLERGYAWVLGSTAQEWYGKNLTANTIGGGAEIRFESVDPPAAGSEQVYPLL